MKTVEENVNPLEFPILHMMRDAGSPLGAGAIGEVLESQGISISEAGIGRALRSFRQRGLLERRGFQGHVITDTGIERLADLEAAKRYGETLKKLMEKGLTQNYNVVDILTARRALEREAAYLAALKATPEDIAELENIVKAQYSGMEKNENYADHSAAFHKTIMKMARSSILSNLYDLIGLSVQWQDFFIGTFKMYNQPVNVSHEKVLQAIKDRDPERASMLMGKHLTDVVDNAKNLYLE